MKYSLFENYKISKIGLGCSKMGSLGGCDRNQAIDLLEYSAKKGITFFDTASTYGQGDSELYLGEIIKRYPDIFFVTKIGKVTPLKAKLIKPLKKWFRLLSKRFKFILVGAKKQRGNELPSRFDIPFLKKQLKASFKRLGVKQIPLVMLHNPSCKVIDDGVAINMLHEMYLIGAIKCIGVSVDDLIVAKRALLDNRIHAIQLPLMLESDDFSEFVIQAKKMGKFIIVREVMKGLSGREMGKVLKSRVENLLSNPNLDVVLIGTTQKKHLKEFIQFTCSNES